MPTVQQLITHLSQQLGLVPTTLAQHQANMNALQQLAELVAKLEQSSKSVTTESRPQDVAKEA